MPPEDREQAHNWLSRLLARYPDTRCVATVRPLAVGLDWLRSDGFEALRLPQLLQRIVVRLVREGRSEFTRGQALRQTGRALAGMERVSAQGRPGKILTHLLNRSGLLQQHADDTYQFIHRTFQGYLAAKEFVEDDHLNELLRHADEETWQDVILLAAGHCGRRELAVLVSGLLNVGLRYEAGTEERTRQRCSHRPTTAGWPPWPGLDRRHWRSCPCWLTRQHLIGAEELGNRLNASPG